MCVCVCRRGRWGREKEKELGLGVRTGHRRATTDHGIFHRLRRLSARGQPEDEQPEEWWLADWLK